MNPVPSLHNDHDLKLQYLRQTQFFAGLGTDEQWSLCEFLYIATVPENEIFIRQDELGDSLFVIVFGTARVYWRDEQDVEISFESFGPGECLGEMGYFTDGRRSASVRATAPLTLLKIYYADLDRAFAVAPSLASNVLKVVTKRLRNINFRFQENVRKTRVVEQSLHNLQSFMDVSEILSLRVDIEGLIERVVYAASNTMNADRATLFLVDPSTGELWSKVAEGAVSQEIRVPRGTGVIGWVVQHDEVVNIRDPYNDPRFNKEVDRKTGYVTKSILCGPVKNLRGEIVGVVQVINKHTGVFDAADETMFRAFAYQTTIALENFHVYQQMMRNHEKLVILLDVATSLNQSPDLNWLITRGVGKVASILHADRCALYVLDRATGTFWTRELAGDDVREIHLERRDGLLAYVHQTGKTVNLADAYDSSAFHPEVDEIPGYRSKTVLCVPLVNRNREIIGIVKALNKQVGAFDVEDESLLRTIASQIGMAMENAQLHDRIASTKNYLESVQDSISNSIVTLDTAYRVVIANKAAQALFGKAEEELLHQDLRQVLGESNAFVQQRIQDVYETRQSRVDYDVDLALTASKPRSVNLNILPLFDHKQEFQGLILIFEDITRQKRVKSTLVRYMAKDIAEKVLEEDGESTLGGQKTEATILFCDIRGFTTMAEHLRAEETVEFLNDYFSRMVDIIFRHRGILDKYIGDAVMAVFGVPYPSVDDANNAVRTALDMTLALREINAVRLHAGKEQISFGIGINTGNVISGNVGSEKRMEYTVIGDSVNLASRLEALTRVYDNTILISEYTHRLLSDEFCTRPIDYVTVRGRQEPVEVFDVLGYRGRPSTLAEEHFGRGFDAYQAGDWERALEWFRQGSDTDALCRLFDERCQALAANPPAVWDKVWRWGGKG